MAIAYGVRGYDYSLDMHPRGTTGYVILVTLAEFAISLGWL
jgi:hypothetical protein